MMGSYSLHPSPPPPSSRKVNIQEVLTPLHCDDCGGEPEEKTPTYRFESVDGVAEFCTRHLALRYVQASALGRHVHDCWYCTNGPLCAQGSVLDGEMMTNEARKPTIPAGGRHVSEPIPADGVSSEPRKEPEAGTEKEILERKRRLAEGETRLGVK